MNIQREGTQKVRKRVGRQAISQDTMNDMFNSEGGSQTEPQQSFFLHC